MFAGILRNNRSGKIVADFQIEHTAQGWQRWREQVAALGPGLAACVETARALSSSSYWKSGVAIYPISTTSAKAYRQPKVPSALREYYPAALEAWVLKIQNP